MKRKNKKILITVTVLVILLNPLSLCLYVVAYEYCRKEWLWLTYNNDISEYVYNSEKNDYFGDPALSCMNSAIEEYDRRTCDSLKMDSSLVELLKFRNKKGELKCSDFYRAAITHVICTQRYHLLPYIEVLRDSFKSYPEDMHYYIKNADGVLIPNKNIKEDLDEYIDLINRRKENIRTKHVK